MENGLALLIVVAGIAMMVGGRKAAGAVLRAPFAWAGRLLGDLLQGAVRLVLDLVGGILRGGARLADRGARQALRLPPPQRPQRRRPRRRRDDDDDRQDD